jgi:type II secretory pathway component GspD/PulD (secretin)
MTARTSLVVAVVTLGLSVPTAWAQPPAKPPLKSNVTALMVDVTISRYQGDKRISSLPYTIAVLPNSDRSTLRVGGEVPIPSVTFTPAKEGEAKSAPLASYSYRNIGTNIDVTAASMEDDRYRIIITIEETSVYPQGEAAKNDTNVLSSPPAFRRLSSANTLALRHGQSVEYTAATDRLTGEIAKVSVKLTVVN